MEYPSKEFVADHVSLGEFTLSASLVAGINAYQAIHTDAGLLSDEMKTRVKRLGDWLYIGEDPQAPQIGDLKIAFEMVPETTVSIVSKQIGNTFEPYMTSAGGEVQLLSVGTHSSESMFQSAQEANKVLTWILRGAGFLAMMIGLNLLFRPLSVIADVVPFIGSVVGAGTGIVAFLLAAALSILTIAVAWLFYRPILAIALIAVSIGGFMAIRSRIVKSTQSAAQAGEDQQAVTQNR